jgi:ubiquitin carboxyl-terminal hydrolase 7
LLQGVLVHSGDLNAGHYYALIRPKKGADSQWFKYDDDRVVPASRNDVFDANFGGDSSVGLKQPTGQIKAARFYTNAYMLVYVRETDEDEILGEVS